MKKCIFCQIAGNQETERDRIIFSDNEYIAMLDLHPVSKGHFIVFPKKHFSEIKEFQNKGKYFELVVELAEKETKRLGAKAYFMKLNNNVYKLDNDPLHVGHIHMHVVPKFIKAVE